MAKKQFGTGFMASDDGDDPTLKSLTEAMESVGRGRKRNTQNATPGSLVLKDSTYIYDGKFQLSTTGLEAVGEISADDWRDIGNVLSSIDSSIAWWIGDWANMGLGYVASLDIDVPDLDTPDGRYSAIAVVTGYKYQTLRSYASICANVAPHVRRDDLSFGHHRLVAKLDEADQIKWLERAAHAGWTIRDFRDKINGVVETSPPPITKQAKQITRKVQQQADQFRNLKQRANTPQERQFLNNLISVLIEQLEEIMD